jgi:RNA recognition motif-containing protein
MDDDALKALFEENGVKVTSSRIVKRPFGVRRSKGFGFVDTADNEEQKKALALDGKDLDGRAIAVKVALQHQRDPAESLEAVANAAEQGAVTA